MNIERIKFDDKNALGVYLLNLIEKLNQDDEYNIFLHQINECGYKGFNINNVLEVKINSIFANRLRISHYSSLSGTTKLMGTSKNFNVDKILDYNYYNFKDKIAVCVIAIPKYIIFHGEKLEFSSYKGKTNHDIDDELAELYKSEFQHLPDAHHRKCSLFDAVKTYHELPRCYMLGVVNIKLSENLVEFINPNSHLIYHTNEEALAHKHQLAIEVDKLFDKYSCSTPASAIVRAYKDEDELRYQESLFDL